MILLVLVIHLSFIYSARRSCRIKLADFGIAKLVEAATLKAHTLVGTFGSQLESNQVVCGFLWSFVMPAVPNHKWFC